MLVGALEPENDRHVDSQAHRVRESGGTIVVAWGNDGWSRHADMLALLGRDVHCFGLTDAGFPRHASMRGVAPNRVAIRPYPHNSGQAKEVEQP